MAHDVWVEVDLEALRHNLKQVREVVGDAVDIMAVVKANGYGHGYVEPARAFIEAGARSLAITRLDEGLCLRNAGISSPILLLSPIQAEDAEAAIENDLSLTVTSAQLARAISDAAQKLGKAASVHVKVDTGMSRLGVMSGDAAGFVESLAVLPGVHIAGIYTHFATAADADFGAARSQWVLFQSVLGALKQRGIDYGMAHAANSAAILRMPDSHLDMVRPGTILFGQYPSKHTPKALDLRSAFKLKARICEVKELPAGARVGYGGEFRTTRPTKTAVIPIGWADGFTLAPEVPIYRQNPVTFALKRIARRIAVEVNGEAVPVIGRIAMQMAILDVTDLGKVELGDDVTIPAMRIPVSPLVPRVYI